MNDQATSTNSPRDGSPSIDVTRDIALKDTGSKMVVTMADCCGKNANNLNLPDDILTGIRVLSYDHAIKVAIKFKTHREKGFYKDLATSAVCPTPTCPSATSHTHRGHARLVDGVVQLGTERGAPAPGYHVVKPGRDERIVTLCLQNLVKLWSCERNPTAFDFLYAQYETYHA
ncbi:hypothetical protein QQX98_000530 [Neonectria punicea]|uniref:Uncharacterized protein n=1 Tax=Neonectria punicea TaxID=979145 RepID=A0ABR1HTV7_9HYPO